jgi:hypothetical protein
MGDSLSATPPLNSSDINVDYAMQPAEEESIDTSPSASPLSIFEISSDIVLIIAAVIFVNYCGYSIYNYEKKIKMISAIISYFIFLCF